MAEKQSITRKTRTAFQHVLIQHVPDKPLNTREEWDSFITAGMEKLFAQEPARRKATDSEVSELFDEYILFQSATMGWRITLGTEVQRRMSVWWLEPSGPKKFKKLGEALALSAERVQGRSKPPVVDPSWYEGAEASISELKLLFTRLAQHTNVKGWFTSDGLLREVSLLVRSGSDFPVLRHSIDSLLNYLKETADVYVAALRKGNKFKASPFYYDWAAWRTGHSVSYLQDRVSEIGSKPR